MFHSRTQGLVDLCFATVPIVEGVVAGNELYLDYPTCVEHDSKIAYPTSAEQSSYAANV